MLHLHFRYVEKAIVATISEHIFGALESNQNSNQQCKLRNFPYSVHNSKYLFIILFVKCFSHFKLTLQQNWYFTVLGIPNCPQITKSDTGFLFQQTNESTTWLDDITYTQKERDQCHSAIVRNRQFSMILMY